MFALQYPGQFVTNVPIGLFSGCKLVVEVATFLPVNGCTASDGKVFAWHTVRITAR